MKKRFVFKKEYGIGLYTQKGTEIEYFCRSQSVYYFPHLNRMEDGEKIEVDIELIPISREQTKDYEIHASDDDWGSWCFFAGKACLTSFLTRHEFRYYYKGIEKSAHYGVIVHY